MMSTKLSPLGVHMQAKFPYKQLASTSLLISLIFISCSLQLETGYYDVNHRVDGTLCPGMSGVNVVIAVLEKIEASRVFEWFSNNNIYKIFFRRMAYVESRDGRNNTTGGIWGLSQQYFDDTQHYVGSNPNLRQTMNNSAILNVDWMNINLVDLHKPMYSGLAAVLHLHEIQERDINFRAPIANGQKLGTLWQTHFNGDNITRWYDAENDLAEYNEKCSVKSDIVFVLDVSHSISNIELTEAKNMVYNFTDKLNTSNGDNRIGIILVRSDAHVYLPLGIGVNNTNKVEFLQKIADIPYIPYHYTNTADGLCKLSTQNWRVNDSTILQVAIVFTDGRSNYKAKQCKNGTTKEVATFLHKNHSHILVLAVGIGDDVNNQELYTIASRNHLVTMLDAYNEIEMSSLRATLEYQVCYTLSDSITVGKGVDGTMQRGQIKRWVLEGIGGDGVTVRLCVRSGRITFYVSYNIPSPSEVINDNSGTVIVNTTKLAIDCSTLFVEDSPTSRRQKRQAQTQDTATGKLYITIYGHDNESVFSLVTVSGNVTIDINECERDPHPCNESALCYNTDGSFYCECQEGYIGNGFECRGPDITHTKNNHILHIESILPSSILCTLVLFVLAAIFLILVIVCWRKKKYKSTGNLKPSGPSNMPIQTSEIQRVRHSLKKVPKTFSATNPNIYV